MAARQIVDEVDVGDEVAKTAQQRINLNMTSYCLRPHSFTSSENVVTTQEHAFVALLCLGALGVLLCSRPGHQLYFCLQRGRKRDIAAVCSQFRDFVNRKSLKFKFISRTI